MIDKTRANVSSKQQVNDLFTQTVDDWAGITTTRRPNLTAQNSCRDAVCHPDESKTGWPKGSKILDVGCGTRPSCRPNLPAAARYLGHDLSAGMVELRPRNYNQDR